MSQSQPLRLLYFSNISLRGSILPFVPPLGIGFENLVPIESSFFVIPHFKLYFLFQILIHSFYFSQIS
jgi:hypothetical protein